jgi:hypothetical protein
MIWCLRLMAASRVATLLLTGPAGAATACTAVIPQPTARGINHGEGVYLVGADAVTGPAKTRWSAMRQ